jgi:hypothetical protein
LLLSIPGRAAPQSEADLRRTKGITAAGKTAGQGRRIDQAWHALRQDKEIYFIMMTAMEEFETEVVGMCPAVGTTILRKNKQHGECLDGWTVEQAKRILIVDDEDLSLFLDCTFDLVLTDFQMPGLDGLNLAKCIKITSLANCAIRCYNIDHKIGCDVWLTCLPTVLALERSPLLSRILKRKSFFRISHWTVMYRRRVMKE